MWTFSTVSLRKLLSVNGMLKLSLGVAAFCLWGCSGEQEAAESDGFGENRYTVETEGFVSSDEEIAQAIEDARESFAEFVEESLDPDTNGVGFVANIGIDPSDADLRNMIQVSTIEPMPSGRYEGVVSNFPAAEGLASGDQIEFGLDHVIEWMWVDDGKIRGAQVKRVLRSRMSEAERLADDKLLPFEY